MIIVFSVVGGPQIYYVSIYFFRIRNMVIQGDSVLLFLNCCDHLNFNFLVFTIVYFYSIVIALFVDSSQKNNNLIIT